MKTLATHVWALLLVALVVCCMSCSKDEPTGVRYTAAIEGSIVFAEPPTWIQGWAARSASSGKTTFDVAENGGFSVSLPPGDYVLGFSASFDGQGYRVFVGDSDVSYTSDVPPIRVDERGETKEVNVSLGALEFQIDAPPEWEGEVVRLYSPRELAGLTIENGVASFRDPCVPVGQYTFSLRHGLSDFYFPSSQHRLEADTVDVVPGMTTMCTFDLTRPARIQGRIGGGERSRTLTVRSTAYGLAARYDLPLDGQFDIPVFYDGEVEISVYDGSGQAYQLADDEQRPRTFLLTRGEVTEVDVPDWDVRIEMEGPYSIGDLVGEFHFRSVDVAHSYYRSIGNPRDGVVGLVPPGRYKVEASFGGCAWPWITTWYPNAEDSDSGTVVELTSDPASRVLRFDLRRGAQIEGNFRFRGTQVGVEGQVAVFDAKLDQYRCAYRTSYRGDGRFLLQGLEPGTYVIRATWNSFLASFEQWYPGVDSRDEATPIVLEEGDAVEGIDLWVD